MNQSLRIVALGDLHVGAIPPERLEHELNTVLFPWLEANKVDAVIQLGDWYDKRLGHDSEDAKLATRVVVRLCQLCQSRSIPFRILQGTLSHDYFQLQNYRPLETEYPTFRVIAAAQHEELLPGFDVLWMPEEYPTDYNDFYGRLLHDEEGNGLVYDAIFGHGEIDVAAGWSQMSESERHYGGTPCHAAELLMMHSSGPVWFGHVHTRFRHKKRLGYPGSFTRWMHGEQEAKGFDVLTLKPAKSGWSVSAATVENTLAPTYLTVTADELLDAGDAVDEIVAKIRAAAEGVHRLRVKMESFPIGIEELSLVRGALVDNRSIDIVSAARPVTESTTAEVETETTEEVQARVERTDYLRDQGIPGEERLLRYLHDRFPDRTDVSLEDVRELTAPLAN